ncbi:hypothetical protein [Pyrococcus kukulkanii]|uniref:hypothetical protein n=1 Tax=Pyrococcus kukulkanii TaxID=1609559 RepID=UPI003561478A
MRKKISESGVVVRGISVDIDTELMAKVLAHVKRSSKAQIYREAVAKLFREEFGNKNVKQVIKELGIKIS